MTNPKMTDEQIDMLFHAKRATEKQLTVTDLANAQARAEAMATKVADKTDAQRQEARLRAYRGESVILHGRNGVVFAIWQGSKHKLLTKSSFGAMAKDEGCNPRRWADTLPVVNVEFSVKGAK